jgi:hypothetical protein
MKTFKQYINENRSMSKIEEKTFDIIDQLIKQNKPVPSYFIKKVGSLPINVWRTAHLFLDNGKIIPQEVINNISSTDALNCLIFSINQPQLTKRPPAIELLPKLSEFEIKQFKKWIQTRFETQRELQEFLKANKWALEIMI